MLRATLALLALSSCTSSAAAPPPPAPPERAPAPRCPEPSGVPASVRSTPLGATSCGTITLAAGAEVPKDPGQLVLIWFRPEEHATFRGGLPPPELAVSLIQRARVVSDVSFDGAVAYAIDHPPGDVVVFALFDHRRAFWPTLFGRGTGNFVGAGRGDLVLAERPVPPPRAERCSGERLELFVVEAPEVAASGSVQRRFCVALPKSYAAARRRRYPVVYLLPGLGSTDVAYLGPGKPLQALSEELGEQILVGVDTSTRHGSTYFSNTPIDGEWKRFVSERMVGEIDRRYRTLGRGEGRALIGHSTGGFNAVSLALRYPELFRNVGASAPDALDLAHWLLGADRRVRPEWLAWARLERGVGGAGQFASYGASWTPDVARESGYRFPFDLETGKLVQNDWERWQEHDPIALVDETHRVLSGRIFITVGAKDEFGLTEPARRFSERLGALGIQHEFAVSPGGHFSDGDSGLQAALRFVRAKLPAAQP